eukprot:Pgem_evm1s2431
MKYFNQAFIGVTAAVYVHQVEGLNKIPSSSYIPTKYLPLFFENLKLNHSETLKLYDGITHSPDIGMSLEHGSDYYYDNDGKLTFPQLGVKKKEIYMAMAKLVTPVSVRSNELIKEGPALFMSQFAKSTYKLVYPEDMIDFFYNPYDYSILQSNKEDRAKVLKIQQSFHSTKIAQDSFFESITQSAFKLSWLLRHSSKADEEEEIVISKMLKEARMNQNDHTDFYFLNTESLGYLPSRKAKDKYHDRYPVGAFTLMKHDKTKKNLIPVAIKLIMDDNGSTLEKVYSRANSAEGTWRLAMLAAKYSMTQWGILVGHVLTLHAVTSTVQTGLYNKLAPEHPLRQVLEPFSKYTLQHLPLIKIYNNTYARDSFTSLQPSQYYKQHGIKKDLVKDLGVTTLNKDHGFETTATKFARKIVNTLYPSDEEVRKDQQLKDFTQYIRKVGNLGELVENQGDSDIDSKESLIQILSTYFYLSIEHSTGRVKSMWGPINAAIPCLSQNTFLKEDPKKEQSLDDIMNHMPDTGTLFTYAAFIRLFLDTTPFERMTNTTVYENPSLENLMKDALNELKGNYADVLKNLMTALGHEKDEGFDSILNTFPRNIE